MFGTTGLNELVILMLLIAVLSITGLWPRIIRGLRELRGDPVEPERPSSTDTEVCYKLLGISPSSSWEEVERAYRRKAKIHHPDHGGDEDTMRALNEAYAQIKKTRGQSVRR